MADTATPASPPRWLLSIMTEIDTLEFGDGFAHMNQDTQMYFGTTHIVGVEDIKAFFVKIDEPLNIVHEIVEFWVAGHTCFLRGEATMAKKTAPGDIVHAPFMHIFYLDADPLGAEPLRIETIRITAGPLQTDSVM